VIIRVVDFETTGVAPPAEVIEVGTCDLIGPPWEVQEPVSRLCGSSLITAETRAIHHIAPADVAGREPFSGVPVDGCIAVAAHHADFEAKWLGELPAGVNRICTYKGALRIWPEAPSHSNQVLRYWLEEQGLTSPVAELCQPAHRAGPDAYATAWLLKALLDKVTGKELVAWTAEPALLPRITIGKDRGKKWSDVDHGFLLWMTRQPDMDPDLVWNARRELNRRANEGER
jgi:exodeoxyribonuclease X